jgi:hypothetical protein
MANDDCGGQVEQHSRFHFPNLVLTRLRNGERIREGLQENLGVFTWKASTPSSSAQVIVTNSCQRVCTHESTGLPVTTNTYVAGNTQQASYRHNRPFTSHFRSGGLEFSYLGQDLDEADGKSEETIARIAVRERTAEHLHDVLSGD